MQRCPVRLARPNIPSDVFSSDGILLVPSKVDFRHALECSALECEVVGIELRTSMSKAMLFSLKKKEKRVGCSVQVRAETLSMVEEYLKISGKRECGTGEWIGSPPTVLQAPYHSVVVKLELTLQMKHQPSWSYS